MDIVAGADRVMDEAERKLRKLIEEGLERKLYGAVARVAQMAQGVAAVRGGVSAAAEDRSLGISESGDPLVSEAGKRTKLVSTRVSRENYPKFRRENDRLVKVGWSKKNSAEYEHKASMDAVAAFCGRLKQVVESGGSWSFIMEDILPVATSGGEEIPDYQAYLILAWLRSLNVVAKDGRHSYKVVDADWLGQGLHLAWSELPEISS